MDSLVRIFVPVQHATLISVELILTYSPGLEHPSYCDPMRVNVLQLYLRDLSKANLAWAVCSMHAQTTAVYDAPVFLVRFVSDKQSRNVERAFRLLYSFHQVSWVSLALRLISLS